MNERSFIFALTPMSKQISDKHQAILGAALKLLANCGFHGFSMKQLAKEANVAAGTIYLYFKDRETLIAEVHRNILDDFADNVFNELNTKLTLKQQYLLIVQKTWQFCLTNRWATLSKGQFDHLPIEVLKDQRINAWTNHLHPLINLYEQGRETKQIKPLSNDILVALSLEPFIYIATQQLLGLININELELETMMEAAWDVISLSSPSA